MTDWASFAKRCGDTVRKIRETKDDGVYAKLYAEDVERLRLMLDEIEFRISSVGGKELTPEEMRLVVDCAFKRTEPR